MSPLNTNNPIALQVLMSDTVFDLDFPEKTVQKLEERPVDLVENWVESAVNEVVIKSLGDNQKNILFIVDEEQHEFFSKDAELAFVKTLNALKLNLPDVAVINDKQPGIKQSFDRIKADFSPKVCVFLGSDPKGLGFENLAENIWANEGGIQFLNSFSFENMLYDVGMKRVFWDAIKLMSF